MCSLRDRILYFDLGAKKHGGSSLFERFADHVYRIFIWIMIFTARRISLLFVGSPRPARVKFPASYVKWRCYCDFLHLYAFASSLGTI